MYTTFNRLKFSVKDGCSESSIYSGVCGGNKLQKGLSTQVGQYDTQQHSQFSFQS